MEIVEDVVVSLGNLAAAKQMTLSARDAGAPDVETDGERLRRILENIVENAIKYTPAGGTVEVTAQVSGGSAVVVVQDDGPGIAADHLPRIFERFLPGGQGASRAIVGKGLGACHRAPLAESIGARVSVSSEVGAGDAIHGDGYRRQNSLAAVNVTPLS